MCWWVIQTAVVQRWGGSILLLFAWTTGQTYYLWGQLGELAQGQEISNVKFDIYIGKSYDSCIYESDVPVKVRAGGRYLAAVDIYNCI